MSTVGTDTLAEPSKTIKCSWCGATRRIVKMWQDTIGRGMDVVCCHGDPRTAAEFKVQPKFKRSVW